MTIAINTCKFANYTVDENFVRRFFLEFGNQKQTNHLIILIDEGIDVGMVSSNITIIQLAVSKSSTLYSWYKYQKQISLAIKKHRVNVFITPILFSKIFIKADQLLLLPNAGPLLKPMDFKKAITIVFNKLVIPSIKKSQGIITSSIGWKKYLSEHYQIPDKKIFCVDKVDDIKADNVLLKPVGIEAEGPYFLVLDEQINNEKLIFVLKAFSGFKKRLRSTMKVVFIINESLEKYSESIKAYKYKNDVLLVEKKGQKIMEAIIRNSYAVILNSEFNGFENIPELTHRLGTVLIMVKGSFNTEEQNKPETLTYETGNIVELSGHMMEIYKNEKLRGELLTRNEKILSVADPINIYEKASIFLEEIKI